MAGRHRKDSGATGVLIVDKPSGCTSHDIVDQVRRKLGTRKVGHAGTLDPDATGVLVLGVGKGTKLLQFVTGVDKRYEGEVVFGTTTDSLDSTGALTGTYDMSLTPEQVAAAAERFVGDIEQIPPMVSAVKIEGKRLHELAREGKEVDRPPRPVTIHGLQLEPTDDPMVYRLSVHCSSGTYIRTLAADLGTALGGGAHLRNLRRTAVGRFDLAAARPVDEAELAPLTDMLSHLPTMQVGDTVAVQVRHGRSLGPSSGSGRLAIVDPKGELLAVYESRDGEFRPVKVLVG
ncbi:MAG: tRNA pseudouridine(55) synthase TruB [Acidimicrobiales bacterium]|nr:tRNA pseudouridine(55) synthase TruB [Acidimicrobiales bacterium]